jgi:hypothetical protein
VYGNGLERDVGVRMRLALMGESASWGVPQPCPDEISDDSRP